MKATRFFSAATLIFTAATSFFCTSCIDEYKEDSGYYTLYDQQKDKNAQKSLETSVEIGEDIDSFYDLKAKYEYDGVTEEEPLLDLDDFDKARAFSKDNEFVKIVTIKKYGLSRKIKNTPVKITITATPKADAVDRAQALPDDAIICYRLDSKTSVDGMNGFNNNFDFFKGGDIMNKTEFIQALQKGVKVMEAKDC